MADEQFKRMYQGEWADLRPIVVIAGRQLQFEDEMRRLADSAKTVTRRPGRWEIDGQEYVFVNSVRRMRGLRAKDVWYVGTWFELPEARDIEQYAPTLKLK